MTRIEKTFVLFVSFVVPVLLAAVAMAEEPKPEAAADPVREAYRADAERLEFYRDADHQQRLKLVEKPIMRWANDDDWSGDVFVWTHDGRPEVIGCILSGPFDQMRYIYQEFHLLADKPIAPATVQNGRRWAPAEGLKVERLDDAPSPAATVTARLTQMRAIARGFTADMEADGRWELRLLPQPLMRYGDEQGDVIDGALFCYVWTKGTDPEVILLVECRRAEGELAWFYAPVLFTNRAVWLKRGGREVWHADPHREPAENTSTNIYTTAFARSIAKPGAGGQTSEAGEDEKGSGAGIRESGEKKK